MIVHVADARVIAIDPAAIVGQAGDLRRHARIAVAVGGTVPSDVLRGVRAVRRAVARNPLFRQPAIDGLPLEGVPVVERRTVRSMRIPHVDLQEPVVPPRVPADPVHSQRRHLVRALQAALARVHHLGKAPVEPPCRMALSKGADGHSMQAALTQDVHP